MATIKVTSPKRIPGEGIPGPTPAQVQAEQNRLLENDKARLLQASPAAPLPAVVKPQMLATTSPLTHEQYLDSIAPASLAGRLIKFSKDGTWVITDDETKIDEDAHFIPNVPETLIGWIKFNGPGNPPDKEMGLLYDGYQMPPRESLGDLDQSQWEIGLDGLLSDRWNHVVYLVLQRVDNNELFTYAAMNKTSRRAVGVLLRHYDRVQRTNPGYLPIVCLKVGGYQHRDDRVGWVKTPVIAAMGQVPGDNAVKPPPADFDDEIPFK
jgi:hypothetical protein